MIKLPPLPEPDGWAGKDYYHRPATTLADISKFELEQARYTADQMHQYADACNAALKAQVRVLREDAERYRWLRREQVALSLSSSTVAALVADQSELDAALKASK